MNSTRIHLIALSLGSLLMAPVSQAQRSSANYSMTAEAAGSGGQSASSIAYAARGSLENFGPPSSDDGEGDPVTARSGFAAQLIEVRNLTLVSPTNAIPEGATLAFSAIATYDDGTRADVSGSGAQWFVASGPLASIASDGVATAELVYQNASARVTAGYLGTFAHRTITVRNVDPDDFGTYAADGVADAWQVSNFGLASPWALGSLDPDGDGQINRAEWEFGTNPNDPVSRFIFAIQAVPGHPEWKSITFGPRVNGRTYYLEYRNNLTTGRFATLGGQPSTDEGAMRTVTDTTATNAMRFYRIRAVGP